MLFRHTILYLPAQLLAPLAQFAAAVVWTHWMSPENYGVLTFLVAAQELVFVICLSWWSAFCLRYYAGFDPAETDEYRRSEAGVLALTMLAGAGVSVALLAYLRVLGDMHLVVAAIAYLATRSVDVHFAERARAQERILAYTVAQIAGPVAGFALAFVLVRFVAATPAMALAGFALAQGVAALWLRLHLRVNLSLRAPSTAMIRRALIYGVPMVIGGVLGWISLNAVRFVVQEMGGETQMGLLAVGWALGQRLAGVTAMLVTAAAYPLAVRRLATHSREEAMRQYGAGGTLLLGVVAPAAIGLWQVGPALVDLTVAEPFRAMTIAILPAAIFTGSIRNFRVHYADQSFLLFERTDLGVVMFALEALAVVVCAVAGYAAGGVPGTVKGCLIGTAIASLATFALARGKFGLPLPATDWLRILLGTAIMAFAVSATQHLAVGAVAHLVVAIAIGVIVYAATILILFRKQARGLLRRSPFARSQGPAVPAR